MKGPFLILAAAALFGTTGTAQALGPTNSDPLAVGLTRLTVGGVGLMVAATAMRRFVGVNSASKTAAIVGAIAVLGYQLSFFAGVRESGVALGTVVTIGSGPVLAGLLAWLFLSERPGIRWGVSTVGAAGGIALIAGPAGAAPLRGIVLNVAAGLSYAVFATASKRLMRDLAPLGAMALIFGLGAVLASPLLWFTDTSFVGSPSGVLVALWLGFGATTVAYVLYGHGLRVTRVGSAATLTLFEPVVATVLGVVVLSERPGLAAWWGVGLVGVALVALIRGSAPTTGAPVVV